MLRCRVWVRVYGCGLDTILSSGSPHSPILDEFEISGKSVEVDEQGNFTTISDQD